MKGDDVGFLFIVAIAVETYARVKKKTNWLLREAILVCIFCIAIIDANKFDFGDVFWILLALYSLRWLYSFFRNYEPQDPTEQQKPKQLAMDEKESIEPPKTPEEG